MFGLYFGGQIADRLLSTEKLLAVLHLVGGIAMFALAFQTTFWSFFVVMLVYQLAYMPTMSLTNAICFHHISNAQTRVRQAAAVGHDRLDRGELAVRVHPRRQDRPGSSRRAVEHLHRGRHRLDRAGGVLADAAAHAAGAARGRRQRADEGDRAAEDPAMLVLFIATTMDALVHQCYFQWTSPFLQQAGLAENWIMPAMSVGQIAEIASMAALGWALARLGWRWTMTLGILAHAARFFVFAIGDPLWLMVAINVVHGMCYAFFFAAVYIFVDERCPRDARASAQGLFNLVILGIGPFAGSLLWGWLGDVFRTADGAVDFSRLFLAPAVARARGGVADGRRVPPDRDARLTSTDFTDSRCARPASAFASADEQSSRVASCDSFRLDRLAREAAAGRCSLVSASLISSV